MKFTLKALRVNKNLTQKQVAQKLGVSKSTVCKWEHSKAYPDVIQIKKIEKLYGVMFEDIIFLPDNNPLTTLFEC